MHHAPALTNCHLTSDFAIVVILSHILLVTSTFTVAFS
jgi:hypothetical protein